jgi:uncharacterized protein
VWHGGDIGDLALADSIASRKPFRAVYGNIDGHNTRLTYPEVATFLCEKVKVLIIHIGGYPGKYPAPVKRLLQAEKPKIFICGHSHILRVMYDKDLELLHINPGACGVHGFHHVRTAVRFMIDGEDIRDLAVIELGGRVRKP